jgi:hypothetical protein
MVPSLAARAGALALALVSLSTAGLAGPAAAATDPLAGCPCTLWPDDAVPGTVDYLDAPSVELGVRFTLDVPAPITGMRFYKAEANTGPHIGSLWTADGTLLARATFTGETGSGWQQVSFDHRIDAVPDTLYVVSYHTSSGHYSADNNYFTASGYEGGIINVPNEGGGVLNGRYDYGPDPVFPTKTYLDTNYWVDVVVGRPVVTAVAITAAPGSLAKGLTRQLGATGTWSTGATADITTDAQWTSSNPAVATVSASGLLTATGVGPATITVTKDGVSASVPVTVTPAVLLSVAVTPGSANLRLLGTQQLRATVTYTDGTIDVTAKARWTTSNVLVAIPGNVVFPGKVLGLLPGTAVITASFEGKQGTAPVTVRW